MIDIKHSCNRTLFQYTAALAMLHIMPWLEELSEGQNGRQQRKPAHVPRWKAERQEGVRGGHSSNCVYITGEEATNCIHNRERRK